VRGQLPGLVGPRLVRLGERQQLPDGLRRRRPELGSGFALVARAAGATGGGRRRRRVPLPPLAPGSRRSAAGGGLALQRHLVQFRFVVDHVQVVQVRFHPPHHLRLFEHLLRIGRRRRLLPSVHGGLALRIVLRRGRRQLVQRHHGVAGGLTAQLQHRQKIVRAAAHVAQGSNLLGDHPEFFEVD
jgi:hypothetical protein